MRTKTFAIAVFATASCASGAAIGYAGIGYLLDAVNGRATMPWADALALLLSMLLGFLGVAILVVSLARRSLGAVTSGEDARSASPAQVAQFQRQGGVLLLAAVLLVLPILAAPGGLVPSAPREAVMAAIIACFAAQTFLNLRLWAQADEFDRRLISNTSATSFWVAQSVIFLWGAAARVGVAPSPGIWDVAVFVMTVYLMASAYVSVRHGASQG